MKKITYALVSLLLSACKEEHAEHQRDHGHEQAPVAEGSANLSPVQNEMHLLTSALQTAVASIGAGDVRPVEHELHRVHQAKEATEQALHDGSYRPPKNADKLDRFRELDEAFHGDLERLADASHRNDVSATADALGAVMQRCQGCHGEFRR